MKNLTAFFLLIYIGCSPVYFQPEDPGVDYRWEIENWQKRIQNESWNEAIVDNIMSTCLKIARYEQDSGADYWKTYREFIKDFSGDCEDIATFMYGTLKRLDYPKDIRLRIIRMPLGDHAVLMVELPNGRWKMFNSIPIPGDMLDIAVSRTLVEWDDKNIYYP
jgi:hypothetical protein